MGSFTVVSRSPKPELRTPTQRRSGRRVHPRSFFWDTGTRNKKVRVTRSRVIRCGRYFTAARNLNFFRPKGVTLTFFLGHWDMGQNWDGFGTKRTKNDPNLTEFSTVGRMQKKISRLFPTLNFFHRLQKSPHTAWDSGTRGLTPAFTTIKCPT